MQDKARLVIIGAGIVGGSIAYHLAKMGWRDMMVIDQGPLFETGGSTSHAPGLMFLTNGSRTMTELAKYSAKFYGELTFEGQPAFYPTGGIEVAQTEERWADLHRKHGWATSYDLEAHLLTPAEVQDKIPLIDPKVIKGGYYVPDDGDAKAVLAVSAMAREAEALGAASFHGFTMATEIETKNGRVTGVMTDQGRIETELVMLCTNIWSPVLAAKVGVNIPLMAVQHQYAKTEPLESLAGETREIVHPILRNQDKSMYFRQHADAYGIGSYQHDPLLVAPPTLGKVAKKPFTSDHFEPAWAATVELLPELAKANLTEKFNGMFAFTPDAMPILGEAPGVKGLWSAVGVWVTHSGGVGRVMAEWLNDGVTSLDLREADINRFHPHVASRTYTELRCAQQYREVYDIIHPLQQMENPRNLRVSPFYIRQVEQQGQFFESVGWERPQWYQANETLLAQYEVPTRGGWEAQYWSPIQGAEHLATREQVALYDLTAFTKIEVSGPNALQTLNFLAANQIDQPVGKVVYTALLNEAGGIRADLTVTRLAEDRFLVLTGGGIGMLDLAWIRQHAQSNGALNGAVHIEDVSSKYCAMGLWGPKARDVLQSVCEDDVSHEAFPYFTAKEIFVQGIPALALRVSYAGELGWEIYTLSEYGLRLWDMLWEAGQTHSLVAGGGGAFDTLRLEKGYRLWGNDIHTEYNPYEAGLGWAVRLNKGAFIGRDALLKIREQGIQRKLCCMTFDSAEGMALGKEPILVGDTRLGYVTSAGTGYSIGKHIAYGYLPINYATPGTQVEIAYFDKRFSATVMKEPLFDPKGLRLKA